MTRLLCFALLLHFLFTPSLQAQNENEKNNTFTMSAQIRARGEYRNGALFPFESGDDPAYFINNRARISMDYMRSNLQLKFSAQHVGVWGQDPQIDKNGRFMLNEAWAKMYFGNDRFFAQLGRFALAYDDERILGGLDWNVAGRFHDALRLGYEYNAHTVHAILALNQNDERISGGSFYIPGGQPYKNMQTLWYQYKSKECPFRVSLLAMNLGFEGGDPETKKADNYYMQTFGANLGYQINRLNINASGYYQSGKTKTDRSVSAFLANVELNYLLSDKWSLNGGFDYLSGSSSDKGTYKAFDPLYGTHHKFYGAMDYFYASAFKTGYAPGLTDSRIGTTFKPSKTVNMNIFYHYFATAVCLPELKKSLGSEIDLQLNVNVMKDVSLSAGYSFMFGTRTMDVIKGGNHNRWQDWAWVSININPQILKVKW
ncbi:MAG: alginate export family protein [Bacteroidales bacterium]